MQRIVGCRALKFGKEMDMKYTQILRVKYVFQSTISNMATMAILEVTITIFD